MNVLGGYQKINLSPADLTASTLRLDGLSKACANANGKAVLVKMPDGTESFGAVKEVTGGFQLSVMGADSKVSQFNVDDTDDTFTREESAAVATGEVDISSTYVDITTYTASSPYTAPSDGYLRVFCNSAPSAGLVFGGVVTEGDTPSILAVGSINEHTPAYGVSTAFVKKGTKLGILVSTELTGGSYNVRFYPSV